MTLQPQNNITESNNKQEQKTAKFSATGTISEGYKLLVITIIFSNIPISSNFL